jgi:predicted aspartyl protease
MAFVAADWTIDRQTGNIRYTGDDHNEAAPSYATVIEFHRALQALADNASSTGADDELDITDNTPSDRSTDNIVTLNAPYNIDDGSSEHLYDGSIIQNGGADIYDGFVNFGNAAVQIQVLQNGAILADDWWNKSTPTSLPTHDGSNDAATLSDSGESWTTNEWVGYTIYNTTDGSQGLITANTDTTVTAILYGGTQNDWDAGDAYLFGAPLNSNSAAGISHRFMLKTRSSGSDIDGRRLIGISRRFGNTYSEFKVNGTSRGNNVFALSDATDLNNQTSPATVSTWDAFANDNVGFDNSQDVDNNAVNEEYYSRWDISTGGTPASPTINNLYEWAKWITTQGTSLTLYGISGEIFRGITFQAVVDNPTTTVDFSAFEDVTWTGGTGQLLAVDNVNAPTKMWIQILTGVPPANDVFIQSVTNGASTQAQVDGTVTDREPLLTRPFLGASTGSSIIGGYGIGIASEDLTASDILFDLGNNQITPPNNVTVSIGNLTSTEDYVTVAQRGYRFAFDGQTGTSFSLGETLTFSGAATATAVLAEIVDQGTTGYMIVSEEVTGSFGLTPDNAVITGASAAAVINGSVSSDINKRQFTVATSALSGANITAVIVSATIPTDTPSSGILRVQDNNGFYRRLVYSSYTSATFTIDPTATEAYNASTATDADFNVVGAAIGNNVYIGYIDLLATAATESFTAVYSANRNLFVRVRDGGGTPIKTFETTVTMGSSGGSATAIRTTDE